MNERACDGNPLLFPSAQLVWIGVETIAQPDLLKQCTCTGEFTAANNAGKFYR